MRQLTYFDDRKDGVGMCATLEAPFPALIEGESWQEVERKIADLVEEQSRRGDLLYWVPIRSYLQQCTRGGWIVDDDIEAEHLRILDDNRWMEDKRAAEELPNEDIVAATNTARSA